MMQALITKFGGTSVSSRETWEHIADITRCHLQTKTQPIIVCSALSQASNKLEKMTEAALINEHFGLQTELIQEYHLLAHALEVNPQLIDRESQCLQKWLTGVSLLGEAPAKTRAQILSLGELMMTRLGHAFLQKKGLNCLWFDAREALAGLAARLSGTLIEVEMPEAAAGTWDWQRTVMEAEIAANYDSEWQQGRDRLSESLRSQIERGRAITAVDYRYALERIAAVNAAFEPLYAAYDGNMTPAVASTAPRGNPPIPTAARACCPYTGPHNA